MRPLKMLAAGAALAALATLPATSANAGWYRHNDCFLLALPFCVAGAVVGTAAVVATAPFVVAGDVLDPGPRYYYHRRWGGPYGGGPYARGPWAYYGAPPGYYRGPAYYGDYPIGPWRRPYYGPPPGY